MPEPVCQTTKGKCLSSFPSITSSAAKHIASESFGSILLLRQFTKDALFFRIPYALINSLGNFSSLISKLFNDR